jgi:hypothetical protein
MKTAGAVPEVGRSRQTANHQPLKLSLNRGGGDNLPLASVSFSSLEPSNSRSTFSVRFAHSRRKQVSSESKCLAEEMP